MNTRRIEHLGIVESIKSQSIVVSFVQESACSACAVAQLCHGAEKQGKTIEVPCADASRYGIGQSVLLVGRLGLGLRATLWAYVVPLVVLMAVLIVVSERTGSEGAGAIVALLSLIPYYIVLYLLRHRLQRTFSFSIQPAAS